MSVSERAQGEVPLRHSPQQLSTYPNKNPSRGVFWVILCLFYYPKGKPAYWKLKGIFEANLPGVWVIKNHFAGKQIKYKFLDGDQKIRGEPKRQYPAHSILIDTLYRIQYSSI